MSVMKYRDPTTGEIKKVGSPKYDVYSKNEVYNKDETYNKNEVYNKNETYNKNEVYNKNETDTLLSTAGSKPTSVLVTLTSASWDSSALTQTITVTGVSAVESTQLIQPIPTIASQTAYYDAGILCTAQGNNSLTFTASAIPTSDLTVYIVLQELA